MNDAPRDTRGVLAYRWMLGVASGATSLLALLILATVKETAADVNTLKIDVSTVKATQGHQNARIDGVERRNDQQDGKIDDLQRRVWRFPERATP